jgi:quinol monooxygenase YgiN
MHIWTFFVPLSVALSTNLLSLFQEDGHVVQAWSSVPHPSPYCVNLQCIVKQSCRDEFLSLVRNNQRLTLEEPEALQYTVGEDIDISNVFYIHEQFRSPEGFAYHKTTPHNAEWQLFRKEKNPFESAPVVHFYHGTHAPERVPVRDAFCLNVQLSMRPEVREEFLKVIENNARGSNQDEPLCLQYIYGEDTDTPNVFHFHEQFTGKDGGKEGFDAHAATDHFAKWEHFLVSQDPFSKPPIVQFFRTI